MISKGSGNDGSDEDSTTSGVSFYAYHPLSAADSSASDDIALDTGAYEFIDGDINLDPADKVSEDVGIYLPMILKQGGNEDTSGTPTSSSSESQQTNSLDITITGDNSYTDVSISATEPIGGITISANNSTDDSLRITISQDTLGDSSGEYSLTDKIYKTLASIAEPKDRIDIGDALVIIFSPILMLTGCTPETPTTPEESVSLPNDTARPEPTLEAETRPTEDPSVLRSFSGVDTMAVYKEVINWLGANRELVDGGNAQIEVNGHKVGYQILRLWSKSPSLYGLPIGEQQGSDPARQEFEYGTLEVYSDADADGGWAHTWSPRTVPTPTHRRRPRLILKPRSRLVEMHSNYTVTDEDRNSFIDAAITTIFIGGVDPDDPEFIQWQETVYDNTNFSATDELTFITSLTNSVHEQVVYSSTTGSALGKPQKQILTDREAGLYINRKFTKEETESIIGGGTIPILEPLIGAFIRALKSDFSTSDIVTAEEGVCRDFALLLHYMLGQQGIQSETLSIPSHLVVLVEMDGIDYIADPTINLVMPYDEYMNGNKDSGGDWIGFKMLPGVANVGIPKDVYLEIFGTLDNVELTEDGTMVKDTDLSIDNHAQIQKDGSLYSDPFAIEAGKAEQGVWGVAQKATIQEPVTIQIPLGQSEGVLPPTGGASSIYNLYLHTSGIKEILENPTS